MNTYPDANSPSSYKGKIECRFQAMLLPPVSQGSMFQTGAGWHGHPQFVTTLLFNTSIHGDLDRGSRCHNIMSILRNVNFACLCCLIFLLSLVKLKKKRQSSMSLLEPMALPIRVMMSNLRNGHVALLILGV